MLSAKLVSVTKAIVGVCIAAYASIAYAMAFAYSHPALVGGAMGVCFVLLTLPVWLGRLGKSLRWWLAYYAVVVAILIAVALGRFPVEAILASG